MDRRGFLRSLVALTTASVSARVLNGCAPFDGTLGPLSPDPGGVLDLLPGFSYRVLDRRGDRMSDGYRVPASPDGMACFAGPDDTLILMRNHEVALGDVANSAYQPGQRPPPEAYDPRGMGGVTRLVLDARTLEVRSSNLVLTGTVRNCGGGTSPWGWLSAEENVSSGHGYVFLCPIHADRVQPPQRIPALGRFNHEAAVVDETTGVIYLSEDRNDSALYRFVPARRTGSPFVGKLQAMRVRGMPGFDTGRMSTGQRLPVDWVDIADSTPATDSVRAEARSRGAALVRRGEGMWLHDRAAYLVATAGGPIGAGQVFRYRPEDNDDGGTLELLAQSTDRLALDQPDNVTVSPEGVVYLAENGPGHQFVRGLDPAGRPYNFAHNALSPGEFAGLCFSPDGRVMFLNLLDDGITVAITGPFDHAPAVARARVRRGAGASV